MVVYLPDVWTIMPTLEEWEALCQQKAAEAAPPPPEVSVVRPSLTNKGASRCPDPWARVVTALDFCHRKQSLRNRQLTPQSKQQTPLNRMQRTQRPLPSRTWTLISQRPLHPL